MQSSPKTKSHFKDADPFAAEIFSPGSDVWLNQKRIFNITDIF